MYFGSFGSRTPKTTSYPGAAYPRPAPMMAIVKGGHPHTVQQE